MKIVDCFIFYNELDMLNYRLNILKDIVDYFVIVEAKYTFSGKEKPLYFNDNKQMFNFCNNKIIHVIVSDFPHKYPDIDYTKNQQWENEIYHRDCIKKAIDRLNLNDNDVITITDLDEIPDPTILTTIKNNNIKVDVYSLEMDMYYYNLNTLLNNKWYHAKILSYETLKKLNKSCNDIRFLNCKLIKNGGWHLSYFGDSNIIKNKIQNFAHQEFNNNNFTDEEKINNRIKESRDVFDRDIINISRIEIKDNNYLPYKYDVYLTNFFTTK